MPQYVFAYSPTTDEAYWAQYANALNTLTNAGFVATGVTLAVDAQLAGEMIYSRPSLLAPDDNSIKIISDNVRRLVLRNAAPPSLLTNAQALAWNQANPGAVVFAVFR